jgi:hypothetical protein
MYGRNWGSRCVKFRPARQLIGLGKPHKDLLLTEFIAIAIDFTRNLETTGFRNLKRPYLILLSGRQLTAAAQRC